MVSLHSRASAHVKQSPSLATSIALRRCSYHVNSYRDLAIGLRRFPDLLRGQQPLPWRAGLDHLMVDDTAVE